MQRESNLSRISVLRRKAMLMTLLASAFLSSMSTAVTGTMVPNFTAYFRISSALAQWMTSGAALVSGITMLLTSCIIRKLSDKAYFLCAMTFFTAGSLFAVLCNSFPLLLISRLVQAFGCGLLLPYIQIVLLKLYPKERHGFVMGAYAMSSMISSAIAPALSGLLLGRFGWRSVFATLAAGGCLVLFCGSVVFRNVDDKRPAVPEISQPEAKVSFLKLHVFRYPSFRTAVLVNLFLYLISMGNAVILPIFTKEIRGFSDTAYGLSALGGSVISVFVSLYAGRQFDKRGAKPMLLAGVGLFGAFTVTGLFLSEITPIWYIGVVSALQNMGLAALNSPATAMALSGLEGQERIDGSAIYNTLRQIASSFGSMISVLIYSLLGSNIPAVHGVFWYYGLLTAAIACTELAALRSIKGKLQNA